MHQKARTKPTSRSVRMHSVTCLEYRGVTYVQSQELSILHTSIGGKLLDLEKRKQIVFAPLQASQSRAHVDFRLWIEYKHLYRNTSLPSAFLWFFCLSLLTSLECSFLHWKTHLTNQRTCFWCNYRFAFEWQLADHLVLFLSLDYTSSQAGSQNHTGFRHPYRRRGQSI